MCGIFPHVLGHLPIQIHHLQLRQQFINNALKITSKQSTVIVACGNLARVMTLQGGDLFLASCLRS